ncbi:MAG: glutamate racemase [Desulfobacteraceae bacterium]|nr:glutamate racemase [Desulfobacteraceae bacterium]
MPNTKPIGIFDSGIGGLSVLRRIRELLPSENLIYIADSRHMPYGDKPREYVEKRCLDLTQFLLDQEAKAIVVACNTATAAAIATLRAMFAQPFIGIEPGVKPALALSKSKIVGVLATEKTLKSEKFETLIRRFSDEYRFVTQACKGLVQRIEQLDLDGPATRQLVQRYVSILLAQGADTIVLGCTHYPFVSALIEEIAGPEIPIVDTGAAVAKEVQRRLREVNLLSDTPSPGWEWFFTSGDLDKMRQEVDFLWRPGAQVLSLPAEIQ